MSLRKWTSEKWVDIANRKKGGGFPPCGRSKGEKRKNYPKCVPSSKARSMTASQRSSAVCLSSEESYFCSFWVLRQLRDRSHQPWRSAQLGLNSWPY